jgi:hypothetical protein
MPCISLTDFLLGLYVIKLPFSVFLAKIQNTLIFVCSGVCVGQTLGLSTLESLSFARNSVFGGACWPNLRPFNTRKLEFRSKQCVFLGFSNLHKGYKCLDPKDSRVYISRDVTFDEYVFPFASLHPNAGARLRAEILLLPSHLYLGDANDCGHSMSPTEPTDPSTSCAGDSATMGKNSAQTGIDFRAQEHFGNRHCMCRTDGSSNRLEVDPPAPGAALSGASSPGSQPIIAAGGSSSAGEARAQASGGRDLPAGSSVPSSASAGSSAPSLPAEYGVSPASDPRGSTVQLDVGSSAAVEPAPGTSHVASSTP